MCVRPSVDEGEQGRGEGLFAQQNAFLKLVDFFVMKFQVEVLCV